MTSNVAIYLRLLDTLRTSRRSSAWRAEQDRPLLAQLEDLYHTLAADECVFVETQGWRGWPDE